LVADASSPHLEAVWWPALTLTTRACASARADAPTSTQLLAHPAPLACSSEPSQQSQTPSFTTEARRYAERKPRLRQKKRPPWLAHADVPGSSEPSAQSQ
jgi:hypothetical protein